MNEHITGFVAAFFVPHMRHAFETIEELRELEARGELPEMERAE